MIRALISLIGALPQAFFPACLTCCKPDERCAPASRNRSACRPVSCCGLPCRIPTPREEASGPCGIADPGCGVDECVSCTCIVPLAIPEARSAGFPPWLPEWSGLIAPSTDVLPALPGHDRCAPEAFLIRGEFSTHNQRQSVLSVWTK